MTLRHTSEWHEAACPHGQPGPHRPCAIYWVLCLTSNHEAKLHPSGLPQTRCGLRHSSWGRDPKHIPWPVPVPPTSCLRWPMLKGLWPYSFWKRHLNTLLQVPGCSRRVHKAKCSHGVEDEQCNQNCTQWPSLVVPSLGTTASVVPQEHCLQQLGATPPLCFVRGAFGRVVRYIHGWVQSVNVTWVRLLAFCRP